jgi:hypothetical protein
MPTRPCPGAVWPGPRPSSSISSSTALGLILSVILVGSFVLGPSVATMQQGGDASAAIILGASWDLVALTLATGLSVYKPRLRPAHA